jgi:hypothetical protein
MSKETKILKEQKETGNLFKTYFKGVVYYGTAMLVHSCVCLFFCLELEVSVIVFFSASTFL